MIETRKTICRSCTSFCHLSVSLEDGRAVEVRGDFDSPIFKGFSCPKGRAMPGLHDNPKRLLNSLKRLDDGSYVPIESERALDEIAAKLAPILAEHGPKAVVGYLGGGAIEHQAVTALLPAFLDAIGSSLMFTSGTLDQPGLLVGQALHGQWGGGRPRQENWEVFLLVGGNPIVSKQYFGRNPGSQLKALFSDQAKLIVVDPRFTETARRAHVHLQVLPGEDATVVAGLIHLVIRNGWVAEDFVAQNAVGLASLSEAVKAFTPDYVAARAGIEPEKLMEAARLLGTARQGELGTGTGPTMSPRGNLTCYLVNCLQTLRGFWPGAGDEVAGPPVLFPARTFRAQPVAPRPAWGFGRRFRGRDLQESVAGLPTGVLQDEILTPGEGQIRALFLHGGPMMSWPGQARTREAMAALDLLVTTDVEFSPTARVASYVIGAKMQLEVPAVTRLPEGVGLGRHHPGFGWADPYAAYSPALQEPPAGSDLIEPWQLYYGLAQRLGLPLTVLGQPLDMQRAPTTDELYDVMCAGSRIPLSEVRKHPGGKIFDEAREIIQPRDPACEARLQLADPHMMGELAEMEAEAPESRRGTSDEFAFLMIPRRTHNSVNSYVMMRQFLKVPTNPAYMNPEDLTSIGLVSGDMVKVRSRFGEIVGLVAADPDLRRGVLAMSHCFGNNPDEADDPLGMGANTNRLLRMDYDFDPYTGMPRMSAVPVAVEKVA